MANKKISQNKISIIIPVYNVEKYLDKCLMSITTQTYKNLEILLIDDGSTDSSSVICEGWAKKDKRIKVVHKENGGVSSARNKGLDIASGDFISFIDADDIIDNRFYELMLQELINKNCDISICAYKKIYTDNREKIFSIKNNKDVLFFTDIADTDLVSQVWTRLWKKSCITHKFEQTIKNGEDVAFNLKNIKDSHRICYIDKPLYSYFEYNNSLSNKYKDGIYDDTLKLFDLWTERFKTQQDKQMCYNIKLKILISFICLLSMRSDKTRKEIKRIIKNLMALEVVKEIMKFSKARGSIQKGFKTLLRLKMYDIIITILKIRYQRRKNDRQ